MFGVVAAYKNEAAALVHCDRFDNRKSCHAASLVTGTAARDAAHDEAKDND